MQGDQCTSCKIQSLTIAVCEGRVETVRNILSSCGPCYSQEWKGASDGFGLLRTAVQKKHIEIAKLLLRSGVKVNSRHESSCNTPLHFAVLYGDIEFVDMLVRRGANINAKNMHDTTPLHNAVESMKIEIIRILLNQGVNVNVADKSGIAPLHLAIKNNSEQITTLLLCSRANVNGKEKNASGRISAYNGHKEIVKLLLSRGTDVNARDSFRGFTALYCAVERGDIEVLELLLKCGANQHATFKTSLLSPLHIAAQCGHITIAELLLKFGAEVDSIDKCGETAFSYACDRGHDQIVIYYNY